MEFRYLNRNLMVPKNRSLTLILVMADKVFLFVSGNAWRPFGLCSLTAIDRRNCAARQGQGRKFS
jgi:hypothetical protein